MQENPAECRDSQQGQRFGNYSASNNNQHQKQNQNQRWRKEGEHSHNYTSKYDHKRPTDHFNPKLANVTQGNTVSLHHLAPKCRIFLYLGDEHIC